MEEDNLWYDLKLVKVGKGAPAGYEVVEDSENVHVPQEALDSLAFNAIKDGTIQLARKRQGDETGKAIEIHEEIAEVAESKWRCTYPIPDSPQGDEMHKAVEPKKTKSMLTTVPFMFRSDKEPSLVEIAGSFNNWTSVGMVKQDDGTWRVSFEMEPGVHQYKYIVDGKWEHDGGAPTTNDNMGGRNNVIKVEYKDDSSVVLIIGGLIPYDGSSICSINSDSIEVFDPQRMCDADFGKVEGRGRVCASLHYLEKTGQILICGGEADDVEKSCLVVTGRTVEHHSEMLVPRSFHSGAVCSDKLWIFGGRSAAIRSEAGVWVSDGDSYSSIESLSIPGNVWTKEAMELEEARADGSAVAIDNENILLIGGANNHGKDLVMRTQVTMFNTKSGTFTTLAPMLDDEEGITFSNRTEMKGGRQGHGSVFIPPRNGGNGGSGHVLVAGGEGKGYVLDSAQIYDIDANEWSWAGKLNIKRKQGAMVYVDGRVFFMGGMTTKAAKLDHLLKLKVGWQKLKVDLELCCKVASTEFESELADSDSVL